MTPLSVSLAAEGDLDEQVLRRLLQYSGREIYTGVCHSKHGRDHLKQSVPRFNRAARFHAFIILADLEGDECAPGVIEDWLPQGRHPNLVLRVAVRKVESWLLADREGLAKFLAVPLNRVPIQPDTVQDGKQLMIQIAGRSRLRSIREDLVPVPGSTSRVGRNYAGQMSRFVLESWNVDRAVEHSPSLTRAVTAIQDFQPRLEV
jgi:hypothetical protein